MVAALCFVITGIIFLTEGLNLVPTPSADGNRSFLSECRKKLAVDHCGQEIGNELFLEHGTTGPGCCIKLMSLEKCHKEHLKDFLSSPDHANVNATEVWQRSDVLLNRCHIVAGHYPSVI
ncbi:hypothetical protein C3L33_23419, partial [Rhododendron williamsianum]